MYRACRHIALAAGLLAPAAAFNSRNSQTILIPADLTSTDTAQDPTITRTGGMITIVAATGDRVLDMKHAIERLRQMPKPATVEVGAPIGRSDRA